VPRSRIWLINLNVHIDVLFLIDISKVRIIIVTTEINAQILMQLVETKTEKAGEYNYLRWAMLNAVALMMNERLNN